MTKSSPWTESMGDPLERPPPAGEVAPLRPPPPEVEAELVRRLKKGDEHAFDQVLRMYWSAFLRFAIRILGDRDRAEDVVQESFVRLWNHRKRWLRKDTLRPVLYRIVRNRALDEERRRRSSRRSLNKLDPPERDPSPSPLAQAQGSQLREFVEDAIGSLPERRREIFLLVRYDQMSYREVGEVLEVSPQTVANQMSMAMRDLRETLAPHLPGDEPQDIPFSRARSG